MMKKIGVVGVDSGTLLIGDTCYWLNDKEYDDAVENLDIAKQLKFEKGHDGKGVIFSSGFGDGLYEVFADIRKVKIGGHDMGERVCKVVITLIADKEVNIMRKLMKVKDKDGSL